MPVIEGLKNLINGDGRKTVYDKTKAPPSGFEQLEEKEKLQVLAAEIRTQDITGRQRRNTQHYLMALYYQGYQSIEMAPDGASLDIFQDDSFYIENQFRKHVDTVKGMLNQLEPDVIARPGSGSPKDIAASRAADPCLEMIREHIGYDKIKDTKNLYKCLFGTAFIFTDYIVDEKYGTTITTKYRYEEQNDPLDPENPFETKVADGFDVKSKGMEVVTVCSPLEIQIRTDIKGGIDNLPYLQWITRCAVEQVNFTYPGLNETPGSDIEQGLAQHYVEMLGGLQGNAWGQAGAFNYNTNSNRGKVEVCRTWIHPMMFRSDKALEKKFPIGVHVVTVNGRVADYYPERLTDRWTMETLINLPHSMLGDGLYDVVLQQDLINEINTLLHKHLRFQSVGHKLFNSQMIDPNDVKNDPENGWIPTKAGVDMKVSDAVYDLTPTPLSPDTISWLQLVKESAQEMSSAYDPAVGKGIGANTPYSQSVFLAEKAQGRWKNSVTYNRPELMRFWKQLIDIARNNWTEERTRALVDNTGQWTFEQFVGADLDGNVDIRLTNNDFKPQSRAEQMQAMDQRVALEPIWMSLSAKQRLRIEESLGLPPDTNPASNQIMRAYRVKDRIEKGEVISPLPIVDDPVIQLPVFQDFLVSEEGEDLAAANPEAYANVYTYMMTLMQMGMMAMGAGIGMPQPPMPGQPGQMSQPSQAGQPGGQPMGEGQEAAQSPVPAKQPAAPMPAGARK